MGNHPVDTFPDKKNSTKFDFLFAVIAMREVIFFAEVAQVLKEKYGLTSMFLTFYEPGDSYLKKQGFHVASLHKEIHYDQVVVTTEAIQSFEKRHKLQNIRMVLKHERLTHNKQDEKKLIQKLLAYERYITTLLKDYQFSYCVQELGGFIAPLSLYYSALHTETRHVFVEPSPFRGRLFFNVDTLDADLNSNQANADDKDALERYIADYFSNKPLVIPIKDQHHFKHSKILKLFNKRNFTQLFRKIYFKYALRQTEEYNAIWEHVKTSVLPLFRHLSFSYSYPDYNQVYVYFPLHVPLDYALTVRENRYLDQITLLDYLSEVLPYGCQLYIKEHPASIGAYPLRRLRDLLRKNNVKLIHPSINSFDLIRNSKLVLTINSKVGIEALMQGKRVLVLGKAYYTEAENAVIVENLKDLGPHLRRELNQECPPPFPDIPSLAKIYCHAKKGELYVNTPENINNFSNSLYQEVLKISSLKGNSKKISSL